MKLSCLVLVSGLCILFPLFCVNIEQICLLEMTSLICRLLCMSKEKLTLSTGRATEEREPSQVPSAQGGGVYEHPQLPLPQA